MGAYLIIQATVSDREKFQAYIQAVTPLVQRMGGRYIAITAPELLEGKTSPKSVVMSEWPSMEAAKKFWNSPEYAKVKALRAGTGEFNVMLVCGLAQTTLE